MEAYVYGDRRLGDDLDESHDLQVTAVNYRETGAGGIDALRNSEIGAMGHGGACEAPFQLATRPGLVAMIENLRPSHEERR